MRSAIAVGYIQSLTFDLGFGAALTRFPTHRSTPVERKPYLSPAQIR